MIRSLRWRLQLWHAIILSLVVALCGAGFYSQLRRSTLGEIDAELISGARVLEGALKTHPPRALSATLADMPLRLPPRVFDRDRPGPPGQLNRPNLPPPRFDFANELKLPPERLQPGDIPPYFAIFSADGRLLRAQSSDLNEIDVAWNMPRRPLEFRNVERGREVWLRGPYGYWIVVGRDVRQQMDRLRETLIQLIVIGLSVLCLGLVGGWWMSGRAIRPIERISDTAESVSAANLSERIDTATMDRELQSLATTLNSMLSRLEASFQQQSQFTADASHELRTPISILMSHCELALGRPRSTEEYRETIAICQKAGQRMKSLVESLMVLARADAGKLQLLYTTVDLHVLAMETVQMLQPLARERNVDLSVEGDAAPCQADAARIAQVITNLVNNAILYNRPQGKVIVTTSLHGDRAILQVKDTGQGIASADLPHLFDRFYRVDEARSRQSGGSGLGLAICKSIVDAHGGSLTVTSKRNEGSVFELRLYTLAPVHSQPRRLPNGV